MDEISRYAKVTIIIEDGERTITTKIPVAMDIGIHTNAVQVQEWGVPHLATSYSQDMIDFRMDLRALRDTETGLLMTTETSTVAKEVEKPVEVEWVGIPKHPDYIINRDGDVRSTYDNQPVPYQTGLGEDWYALKIEGGWSKFHSRYALRDAAFPNE